MSMFQTFILDELLLLSVKLCEHGCGHRATNFVLDDMASVRSHLGHHC